MSLAGEKFGPFPFRGLHDYPERADYGYASRAQNVDFSWGRMRARQGTAQVCRATDAAGALVGVSSYEWVGEFHDHNASVFLQIMRDSADPSIIRSVVDYLGNVSYPAIPATGYAGRAAAPPLWSVTVSGCDYRRVTTCPWTVESPGRLVFWLPITAYTFKDHPLPSSVMFEMDANGSINVHLPSGAAAGSGADEGPYRSWSDKVPGEWGVVHKSRMFVGGQDGNLRYSSPADLHLWPVLNLIGFDGGALTGGASFNDVLIVGTRNQVFAVEFSGQDSYEVKLLLGHTGIVHHNTICQAARNLFWMSDEGLVALNSSGEAVEVSKNIRRTLQQYAGDFQNATVLHYAARHQIWILLPAAQQIFVYHIPTGYWSTYDWNRDARVQPGALGLGNFAGIDRPIVGARFHDGATHNNEGHVVAFEQGDWSGDWIFADAQFCRASWLSLPIMSLGHHQPRLFRHWRITQGDCGTDGLRAFWLTEGQALTSSLEITGQYADLSQQAPSLARRWGDGLPWWNMVLPASMWPYLQGEQDFPRRASLAGDHTGRWIQLGVRNVAAGGRFDLQTFELDTRRFEGRR